MPRQKSLMTVIRDLTQQEVRSAIQSLLGSISTGKMKPKKRRRRRARKVRGRWPYWLLHPSSYEAPDILVRSALRARAVDR